MPNSIIYSNIGSPQPSGVGISPINKGFKDIRL